MDPSHGLCLVAEELCFVAQNGKAGSDLKFILDRVNLLAHPGELLAIMGPSGSGKTSLLNIIGGRTRNALCEGPGSLALDGPTQVPDGIVGSMQIRCAPVPFGNIYLNGTKVDYGYLRQLGRYVMQSDCLLPFLSVYETIRFAAQLKLTHQSHEERAATVERVIKQLGLESCRDVPIGDQMKKGISGGQRKRVSIAIELLEDPQVLFLDEPTTGLDSSLAFDVLKVVKDLVQQSRKPDASGKINPKTVICTIHQPRKQIYDMFDRLALLSLGKIVYQGPPKGIYDFWSLAGHPVPLRQSVADWSLDLLTAGAPPSEEDNHSSHRSGSFQGSFRQLIRRSSSVAPVDPLITSQSFRASGEIEMSVTNRAKEHSTDAGFQAGDAGSVVEGQLIRRVLISEDEVRGLPKIFADSEWGRQLPKDIEEAKKRPPVDTSTKNKTSMARQVANTMTLAHRFAINRWRNKPALIIMSLVSFFMSLFIALVYVQLKMPQSAADCLAFFNFVGVCAFTGINQSFSHIQSWVSFPLNRPMINREKAGGLYNSASCLIGMIIGDLPFFFLPPIIHTLTLYWIVGIGNTATYFFSYFLYAVLCCFAGAGWLMLACMIAPSSSGASAIAPIGIILSILLCGLWITEDALPVFWSGFKYITWIRYGVNAVLQVRFKGLGVVEHCAPISDTPSPAGNYAILFALGVVFRILAGFALAYTNTRDGLE